MGESIDATPSELVSPEQSSFSVSLKEAESNLNSFLFETGPSLKSSCARSIDDCFTLVYPCERTEEDPIVMHIFNFADNKGYAIMAGDKRVPSLMCLVERGRFSKESTKTIIDTLIMSELSGMYRAARVLPDSIKYDISPLPDGFPLDTKADQFYPVDTVYTDDRIYVYYNWAQNGEPVGTLLDTEWDQDSPYNQSCPSIPHPLNPAFTVKPKAGCTPIAIAQLMAYWKHSTDGTDYEGLNWNYIAPIKNKDSTPTNYTGWAMLKALIAILGDNDNLQARYGLRRTSVHPSRIPVALNNFGYQHVGNRQAYNIDSVRNALHYRPVLGRGNAKKLIYQDGEIKYKKGHSWIFDQYYGRKRPLMVYDTSWHIITGQMLTERLLHINWGWGGEYNGYFANSRFNALEYIADTLVLTKTPVDSVYIEGYYQFNLQINCGIYPE